jgi:2-polyprenyl-3-methyl-5-hydroxy-6-metoxy-1,4-benzoquinol methylase
VAAPERRADRHELYDAHYYETIVDPLMRASAGAMASSIQRELAPRSAIDVGCGTGGLMLELQRLGIECVGFDAADAALAPRSRSAARARARRPPARHPAGPVPRRART